VVEFTCLLNLCLAKLDKLLIEVGLVFLEDLEGYLAAVSLDALLDLCAES